jgi:PPP family 3-phenylpropionic acid transporter
MPPIVRITVFVALTYAVLGAVLPYLPVWLQEVKGLTGAEVGAMLAAASFARVLAGPLAGAWIEGRGDHRTPLVAFAILSAGLYAVLALTEGFWAVAAVGFLATLAFQTSFPLGEAALQRVTEGSRLWPYGRARAVASAVFVGANLGAGALLQRGGAELAYVWILVACGALGVFALALPAEPRPPRPSVDYVRRLADGAGVFKVEGVVALVMTSGVIQATHAYYYAFSSTIWLAQGVPATLVGVLWATAVVAEIAFLALVAPRLERVRPETLILLGGVSAAVRWAAMAAEPGFAISLFLQTLHAGSFAMTLIGTMRLIRARFTPDRVPLAQTMISAAIMAPVFGLATLIAGPLHDAFGPLGYVSAAGLALAGTALAFRLRAGGGRRRPLR